MRRIQTPQLVQIMNIVSNLIFHCNNCDANRAFVTIREGKAAAPSSGLLNAKFTFKGTDRQTDIILIARRRLHSVQRVENAAHNVVGCVSATHR